MKNMSALDLLALAAAIGSALIGGTFFAFSSFVMGALGKLPAPQGIAAMQSINLVVLNPIFLGVFVGTALLGVAIAIAALRGFSSAGAGWLLAGAILYVAGTFLVTLVFNVPRNEALAKMTPDTAEAARLWADYLVTWTTWNTVRAAAAIAALVAFVLGLRLRAV